MTPRQRDRWMQVFFAQARGAAPNGGPMLARALLDGAVNRARVNAPPIMIAVFFPRSCDLESQQVVLLQ
jgi:hypothetical protein